MTAPRFTYADMATCAKRELKYRQRVYERRVADHKMSKALAEKETALMQAIADHFDELAGKERML